MLRIISILFLSQLIAAAPASRHYRRRNIVQDELPSFNSIPTYNQNLGSLSGPTGNTQSQGVTTTADQGFFNTIETIGGPGRYNPDSLADVGILEAYK